MSDVYLNFHLFVYLDFFDLCFYLKYLEMPMHTYMLGWVLLILWMFLKVQMLKL